MSHSNLGEFFTALISCALERCERSDPATLRFEIGRLAHLTFGYSERAWLDQLIADAALDEQSQGVLLTQLERILS